jgi:hypothetical protein
MRCSSPHGYPNRCCARPGWAPGSNCANEDGTAAIRVELTDPAQTDDLVEFLRRCDCTVTVVGPGALEVAPRDLPIDPKLRQPELELDAYLGIWSALRGVSASLAT